MEAIITAFSQLPGSKKGFSKAICLKIPFETVELSMAMDNSVGATENCLRSDIRIYDKKTEEDLTEKIFGKQLYGFSTEEFVEILNRVEYFDKVRQI